MNKERREDASNRKTWIDEEEGDVVCVVTISCYRPIKQLIPNFVNNCRDYNKQLRGSGQN